MKFLCGSCRTKYQISDDKLQGKILTIRCKKCGAKILVRESLRKEAGNGTAVAPVAEEAAELSSSGAVMRAAQFGGSAAFASAFDVSMGASGGADEMPTSIAPLPSNLDTAGIEWYVAIDGEQHGPYAFAEVVRRVKATEVQGRHYVWHEGMESWQRVRDLPDLAGYIPEAPRRSVPPPPPPATEARVPTGPANVVDFATKRAERARRSGDSADLDPHRREVTGETSIASARPGFSPEPQKPDYADQGLISADESRTEAEAPNRAVFVATTAAADHDQGVAELHFERVDDIFADVPRASEADLVPRESTRFFVAAAGVNKRRSQHKLWMGVGVAAALACAAFIGAWASGVVEISLPGIGNPFHSKVNREEMVDEATGRGDLGKLLGGPKPQPQPKAGSRPRRVIAPDGKLNDGEDGVREGGGMRGDNPELAQIPFNFGDMDRKTRDVPAVELPPTNPEYGVEPPEQVSLTEDTIRRVIGQRKQSVSICYEQSLRAGESLRGKLEMSVTVQPTGRVSRADVETASFRGSKLGRCIADKIKDWVFPPFRGEAQVVSVPFVLEKAY